MVDWLSPQALAMSRVDQCVAASGWLSSVRVNTRSTCRSLSLRGVPGRGSSSRPSTPKSINRCRHLPAVGCEQPCLRAISLLAKPSPANSTIRDRKANPCAVFARRDQDCNCSRCSALTVSGDKGRPIPITMSSSLYSMRTIRRAVAFSLEKTPIGVEAPRYACRGNALVPVGFGSRRIFRKFEAAAAAVSVAASVVSV